jgi:hypothetical protein
MTVGKFSGVFGRFVILTLLLWRSHMLKFFFLLAFGAGSSTCELVPLALVLI